MSSSRQRLLAISLATLIVAGGFTSLGIWQLHRAQEVQRLNKPKADLPAADIHSLATAGSNLKDSAINHLVTLSGNYVKSYVATYQEALVNGKKEVISLSVGLLQLANSSSKPEGVLVVRGVGDIPEAAKPPTGKITISGRLYPRQTSDHSVTDARNLGRVDPALVAGIGGLNLFDGYVVVIAEADAQGNPIVLPRIAAPGAKPTTPGFYWQHISYVFIWWFMAGLVLIAPFWSRRSDRAGSTLTSEI